MIGPSTSWMVVFDFFDGELETQRRRWSNIMIPPGLAKQIESCYAKNRHVTGFAATSEHDWYVPGSDLMALACIDGGALILGSTQASKEQTA